MIYFTADTHFGHANIVRMCERPYPDVDTMNEAMIAAWNERVHGNDTVYIVGDMFFRCADTESILKRLKGKKRLIVGNHDGSWIGKVDLERYSLSVDHFLEVSDGTHALTLCHYPMLTWKPGKKTIYMIEDNFFRFWYRFVPRNMSVISSGRMSLVYEQAVKRFYPDYMGLVFEKMCQEYLLRYAQDLPVMLSDVGQWWGTDAKTRKEIQIDIVGTPVEGNEYLIGSCKYRNEKIGMDELELLRNYATVFRKDGIFHYYIFSKGGFTPVLLEAEKQGLYKQSYHNSIYHNDSKNHLLLKNN